MLTAAELSELSRLIVALEETPNLKTIRAAVAFKPARPARVRAPTPLTNAEKWERRQRALIATARAKVAKYEADIAYTRANPHDSSFALFEGVTAESNLPGARARLAQLEESLARMRRREAHQAVSRLSAQAPLHPRQLPPTFRAP